MSAVAGAMTEREMVAALRGSGYLVVKIPACDKAGTGHGRHPLITRTASCEGEEPIPHGHHSSYLGSFGRRVNCQCGQSFSDCTDDPTPWAEHKAEHGVDA